MAKPTYIYLEKDAELAELIEVLRSHKAEMFIIVAPEGSRIFANSINIELLKKEVDELDKKVTFDTPDKEGKKILQKYGFKLVSAEPEVEKEDIVISDIKPKAKETIAAGAVIEQIWSQKDVVKEGKKSSARPKLKVSKFLVTSIVVIVFVITAGYWFLSFYLARARVLITAQKINHSFDYSLTVNANIATSSPLSLILPGKIINVSLNLSKDYPTSGSDVLNSKARGFIDVYNGYSTDPQVLIATTRFQTPDSKIFRTPKRVIIAGAQMQNGKLVPVATTIEVVADQPGPDYNIGPTKFTIPGFQGTPRYQGFWAASTKPMTGGASGQTKVVTTDDFNNARADITKTLTDALNTQFALGYKDYAVLDNQETVSVRIISYLPNIGEAGDKLTINATGNLNAFGFKQNDLNSLLAALEANYLSPSQQIINLSVSTTSISNLDMNKGVMAVEVKGASIFQEKVDIAAVKNALAGKAISDLNVTLKGFQGVSKADISLWPFWIKTIPVDSNKISVNVQ